MQWKAIRNVEASAWAGAMIENVFTQEVMTRPLFEEPAEHHAREDGWSGPHGFVFGGMAQASFASLAGEYFVAANELIECIKDKRVEDYRIANAALFLYRHSFELLLKAALPVPRRTHSLVDLTEAFTEMVSTTYNESVPDWMRARLKELAAIDPGSVAFRYGDYKSPVDGNGAPIGFEAYVDLRHLQASMLALNTALVRAVGEIKMMRG